MNKLKITISIVLICISCTIIAQDNKVDKKTQRAIMKAEAAKQVENIVKGKNIVLEVYRINPTSAQSRNTTDGYTLSLINDTCTCYLPYIGTARSPIYGGIDNISIEVDHQKVTPNYSYSEKKGHIIKFIGYVEGTHEACEFTLQIFQNGKSSIGCLMNSKEYISYSATLKETK